MRKFMFLAAAAALTVPAGAIAQHQDNHAGKGHAQAANARQTVRTNRQTARGGQHSARANPQTNIRNVQRNVQVNRQRHTVRNVQASPQTVRGGQRVVRNGQRGTGQRTRSAYVAPVRNWNYRPVSVGYQLQRAFYGPRYYISDYGAYHLQAPRYGYLRWIRYGDDLLLVNIRTGRVLDVVHYRYW